MKTHDKLKAWHGMVHDSEGEHPVNILTTGDLKDVVAKAEAAHRRRRHLPSNVAVVGHDFQPASTPIGASLPEFPSR